MEFTVRRVITVPEAGGGVSVVDGEPSNLVSVPNGVGVAELLWLDGPPASVLDGGDRSSTSIGFPLEPPPGGLSSRVIRLPPGDWLRVAGDDPAVPGMHATDTLDLVMVLDGEIVLGLEGGEYLLGAGDAVIQQGSRHRWKVVGDRPCTYLVTMLRAAAAGPPLLSPLMVVPAVHGVRRLVTEADPVDGFAAPAVSGNGVRLVDLWQTGGALTSNEQGGDVAGPWQLEPAAGGVSFRWVELPVGDPGEGGWHASHTIDIDVIVGGRVALELRGGVRVVLEPGDAVVQRGTEHRWVPLGPEPLRLVAVMVAIGESAG